MGGQALDSYCQCLAQLRKSEFEIMHYRFEADLAVYQMYNMPYIMIYEMYAILICHVYSICFFITWFLGINDD